MPVSCPAGGRGRKRRLQKANAFVIYMLGEFVEACEAKQVKMSFFYQALPISCSCVCLFDELNSGDVRL